MSVLQHNLELDIISDAEVAGILSHFELEQIMDIVNDGLVRKFNFYPNQPINIIKALEDDFNYVYYKIPEQKDRIDDIRHSTYMSIIGRICSFYNMVYNETDDDLYGIALHLYDFFISGFSANMIRFYANYIYKEKDYLYDYLGMIEKKKNKNISTTYNKKQFKDQKIALINSYIEYVVDSISLFDITLSDMLELIYNDSKVADIILSTVAPRQNLFKDYFTTIVNSDFKPIFLTNIKFELLRIDGNLSQDMIDFIQLTQADDAQ